MQNLVDLETQRLTRDTPPAGPADVAAYTQQIPDWTTLEVDGIPRLQRVFKFKDFVRALEFTNRVGALAEAQDHHPALLTEWGKVTVSWWSHVVKGLHLNDFISAAKTDRIYTEFDTG